MPKNEEQFKKMREDMRSKILKMSSLYFAKYGFGDTKIGDLAKYMGIGQGTIYLYFKSKEELFEAIRSRAENTEEIERLKALSKLPLPAKAKIDLISKEMAKKQNYLTVPAAIRELDKIEMSRQLDGIYRLDHAVTATQKTILKAFGLSDANITYRAEEISRILEGEG